MRIGSKLVNVRIYPKVIHWGLNVTAPLVGGWMRLLALTRMNIKYVASLMVRADWIMMKQLWTIWGRHITLLVGYPGCMTQLHVTLRLHLTFLGLISLSGSLWAWLGF